MVKFTKACSNTAAVSNRQFVDKKGNLVTIVNNNTDLQQN